MGVVYEALDRESNTRVALKTLRIFNGEALLRFKNEFRLLQDLQHPNLVSLGQLMEEAGHWFFTMELIEGSDFLVYVGRATDEAPTDATTVAARNTAASRSETMLDVTPVPAESLPSLPSPLSFDEVDEGRLRNALGQLVCGLRALHEAGKVHRDVKPSNCLVTPEGRVVLLDFGLISDLAVAQRWNSPQEMLVGTVAYMAPEQAATQPVGPAADFYSVGVVLYEALTSTLPFTGHPSLVLHRKQSELPVPPRDLVPEVPADLDEMCMALLALDPAARPQADELLARLGHRDSVPPKRRHTVEPKAHQPLTASAGAFIGRSHELETLWQAYRDARTQAVSVLVTGESGVGKSTMVSHFTARLLEEHPDAVVLSGRCHEREAVPYKAFDGVIDTLSQYLFYLPAGEVTALLPRRAALLLQAFPVLDRIEALAAAPRMRVDIPDPQELRSRVFETVRELLGKVAAQHPLVVIIDDIQWSDADSLALLREILRPPDAPTMLLIATQRTPTPALDHESSRSPLPLPLPVHQLRQLPLPRLSADESRKLAEQLKPPDMEWNDEVANRLAAACEGHPLFLDELVRHMEEGGGSGTDRFQLETALWARVEALDAPGRALVEVVCTAGRPLEQSVAVAAARVRSDDINAIIRTAQVARLLRISGPRLSDAIEPYHDRLRAAVVAHIPAETRRAHHESIARTIEAVSGDPEPLSFHWREAGKAAKAAHYAALAALEASKALAFERAIHFYRQALGLGELPEKTRRGLLIGLGETLINAGRGSEAAEAYMQAAALSTPDKAQELQRRAAEQLLRSGRFRKGFETLSGLLDQVGLHLPHTRSSAISDLMFQRIPLKLHGIRFQERNEAEIPHADLMKIDLCWSVAAGLSIADPLVGIIFITRSLRLSLAAGEPYRLSRALSLESMSLAARSRKSGDRAAALRTLALDLANRSKNPHAVALAIMAEGMAHYWRGAWKSAIEILDRADTMFREQCSNITAGSPTSRLLALWSLFYLGKLTELFRRLPQLLRQAEERGDLQATVNLGAGISHLMALAEDEPERAHTQVAECMQRWEGEHFYFQHWGELVAHIETDLYCGKWQDALTRLDATWPKVESSWLLRIQKMRIDGSYLQGRCHLAAAAARPAHAAPHLRRVEREARNIEREKMYWSAPLAMLLRAGVSAVRNDRSGAIRQLTTAAAAFDSADMALHATVTRYRLGGMSAGDEGRALQDGARNALMEQGVRVPAALVACLAPGFPAD